MANLKSAMHSYILQIDGTTDSEFSMAFVKDKLFNFVMYVEGCHPESHDNIRSGIIYVAMFLFSWKIISI